MCPNIYYLWGAKRSSIWIWNIHKAWYSRCRYSSLTATSALFWMRIKKILSYQQEWNNDFTVGQSTPSMASSLHNPNVPWTVKFNIVQLHIYCIHDLLQRSSIAGARERAAVLTQKYFFAILRWWQSNDFNFVHHGGDRQTLEVNPICVLFHESSDAVWSNKKYKFLPACCKAVSNP